MFNQGDRGLSWRLWCRTFSYTSEHGRFTRGRMDFLVYNARTEMVYFIELDGHTTHKTKEQRLIDATKRNVAANANIPTLVFTAQMILEDLDNCMNSLDFLFKKP